MLQLIIAILMGLTSPAHNHSAKSLNNITANTSLSDTGGEGGHVPPGITPPTP